MLAATNGEEMADAFNTPVIASTTIVNNITAPIEKTYSDSSQEEAEKEKLLGPLLGAVGLILFAMTVVYLLVKRGETRKEKKAARIEDNRRLFLKKHIDIKVSIRKREYALRH